MLCRRGWGHDAEDRVPRQSGALEADRRVVCRRGGCMVQAVGDRETVFGVL